MPSRARCRWLNPVAAIGNAIVTAIRATCPRLRSSATAVVNHAAASRAVTSHAAATFEAHRPLPTRVGAVAGLATSRRRACRAHLRIRGAATVIREAVSYAAVNHAVTSRAAATLEARPATSHAVPSHGLIIRAVATLHAVAAILVVATLHAVAMFGLHRHA